MVNDGDDRLDYDTIDSVFQVNIGNSELVNPMSGQYTFSYSEALEETHLKD